MQWLQYPRALHHAGERKQHLENVVVFLCPLRTVVSPRDATFAHLNAAQAAIDPLFWSLHRLTRLSPPFQSMGEYRLAYTTGSDDYKMALLKPAFAVTGQILDGMSFVRHSTINGFTSTQQLGIVESAHTGITSSNYHLGLAVPFCFLPCFWDWIKRLLTHTAANSRARAPNPRTPCRK